MNINLTENEVEVLTNYLLKKVMQLESLNLHDSRCCIAMNSILFKLHEACKNDTRKDSSK